MAKLWVAGEFVGPGERRTAEELERRLPDGWDVVAMKTLARSDGTSRELDFVVIGRHGIYVLEEKSWGGPIHGNENGWVLPSRESRPSPLDQAESQARALAGWVRQRLPQLDTAVAGHFVAARVVLSADDVSCRVHDPRVARAVLGLASADQRLTAADASHPSAASIGRWRDAIIERLVGLPDRPKVPKTVGVYEVLEVVASPGPGRCLLARHEDGSQRLLKVVERPSTQIPEQRALEETARKREYEALLKLASSGRAPRVDPYFAWGDGACWVFPLHLVDGRHLRADRRLAAPSPAWVAAVAADAFTALATVHAAGVVHRLLNPERIFTNAEAHVVFTDFVLARLAGEQSIHGYVDAWDPEDAWRAPEVRLGAELAVPASDVFGLALALRHWITGAEPDTSPAPMADVRPDLPACWQEALDILMTECLREDYQKRPTAAEMADLLSNAQEAPERDVSPPAPTSASSQALSEGQVVDGRFTIRKVLGRGATATTYLADDADSGGRRVLKVLQDAALIDRLATAEFRILERIKERHFPNVYAIRKADHPYHLEIEYIEGDPLRDWMRNGQMKGNRAFCLRLAHDLAAALIELEAQVVLHRDISPSNILVPVDEREPVVLIDLGLAAAATESRSRVGTPRYLAPEADRPDPFWSAKCDQYALGAVLFELYTGRLPYAHDGLAASKEQPAELLAEERRDPLVTVLRRATAPDPAARYPSAKDLAQALREVAEDRDLPAMGPYQVNPFVTALRGAYRNSRAGNADNRALESEFARSTYVPTRLDTALRDELVAGQLRLVVLSGNPGDGKTAFLQTVREALRACGASPERDDEAGWVYHREGHRYAAVYDASESHGEQSADDLFGQLLHPLSGAAEPGPGYTAAVAANDGRLVDFFERQQLRYGWLWERLEPQLYDGAGPAEGVAVVDLKRRSLVDLELGSDSLYRQILAQFTRPDRWAICNQCVARPECPLWFNAASLGTEAAGLPSRERLGRLLLAVHLQHERRPTLRDLRSALAWLLTGDRGCEEVHHALREGRSPLAQTGWLYYNAAFDGTGGPDLLLEEWGRLDPADVPAPRLDRFLYFHRGQEERSVALAHLTRVQDRPEPPVPVDEQRWLRELKRRWYFEVASPLADDRRLTEPLALLPYRHFDDYSAALVGGDDKALRQRLLTGLSFADGVPAEACRDGLALRVNESSAEDLVVVKQLPATDFRIEREEHLQDRYLEDIHDELALVHRTGLPRLRLGLDLFELLLRMAQGYRPGAVEQGALLEDVALFKQALLAQPTQEVLLVEAGARMHRIRAVDGVISREAGA